MKDCKQPIQNRVSIRVESRFVGADPCVRPVRRRQQADTGVGPDVVGISARNDRHGFTYIEMLVVIALVALCFVPILHMFTQSMDEVQQYSDIGTALQLGRETMESVKNFRLTETQIEGQGTVWVPPEKESPLVINGVPWKVKRYAVKNTDPLEIHVEVFRAENLERPVLELVTFVEDL